VDYAYRTYNNKQHGDSSLQDTWGTVLQDSGEEDSEPFRKGSLCSPTDNGVITQETCIFINTAVGNWNLAKQKQASHSSLTICLLRFTHVRIRNASIKTARQCLRTALTRGYGTHWQKYGFDDKGTVVLFPPETKNVSLLRSIRTGYMAYLFSHSNSTGGFSPGVMRTGRQADQSPPSITEANNDRSYIPIPPYAFT
jgi:hypothetical protein